MLQATMPLFNLTSITPTISKSKSLTPLKICPCPPSSTVNISTLSAPTPIKAMPSCQRKLSPLLAARHLPLAITVRSHQVSIRLKCCGNWLKLQTRTRFHPLQTSEKRALITAIDPSCSSMLNPILIRAAKSLKNSCKSSIMEQCCKSRQQCL